ncbi:LOW QUALITY PROTEIN: small subunit processome component 20 homolog [Benincasa hispida]|uniref:LOW QUALITY PROTEIN: small subunit processome component 20 homolog n=1 Tax=Benincasa hispida TaxID=102211 RepID=UPI0018FF8BB9|nr:LOW QUALITY PROTEIN: small subunit processome component 20 homolog [Benincasa hispida]
MATASHAQAVKSLNKSPGRRRFVFQTFSQRVQEIDIDVYRSLDKVKSEPSEGSCFFRDCLIEWRELNTAEDFISYYEEIIPLVQTLPLVILHKESIFSNLLSRVQIKARLSLEPILRLMAALARDLLEDFLPFLSQLTDALVSLLEGGAAREPEIIEQIFTSWSYIMMFLQKYLTQNIVDLLRVTASLRYYSKDYIQDFMAEATSFLLRNAPAGQLKNGIKRIILEVVKKPSATREYGASALLFHTLRGTSSRFHSRAELVFRFLISGQTFEIGRDSSQGSGGILEVLKCVCQRLCEEMDPKELDMIWKCLFEEITDAISNDYMVYINHLLMLLASAAQNVNWKKLHEYKPMLELVDLLVLKFATTPSLPMEGDLSIIVDTILQLMLVILEGLQSSEDTLCISGCSLRWAPIFQLNSSSLLTFVREIMEKDASVLCAFRTNILRAMNELLESSPEEVIYLLLSFCERLPTEVLCTSKEEVTRINNFILKILGHWIKEITDFVQHNSSTIDINESKLAILWGVIRCCPYIVKFQANSSLLVDLIDALDRLCTVEGDIFGVPKENLESIIGATIGSYLKLLSSKKVGLEELNRFVYLAKRYSSCSQVLVAVADYLDFIYGPGVSKRSYSEEFQADKVEDAVQVFADNLRHPDKGVRISTLRILCHYEPLQSATLTKDPSIDNEMKTENLEQCSDDSVGSEVLCHLLTIESTPTSISTSRSIILLISRVQMALSTKRIPEAYLLVALNGIIGIFQNRFSYIWDQASDCLAFLIRRLSGFLWDKLICYFQQWLFLLDQPGRDTAESSDELNDLVRCFRSFVVPSPDSTPLFTLLSLVLQSLQKNSTIVESQSQRMLPLFLTFLGYNTGHVDSVDSFKQYACKSKEWKCVLKEWLNLLRKTRNLKSFYKSDFLKEVLEQRLLDDNDAEIQSKVLDCLLMWKDDFLIPYEQHLKNLISPKTLREELTRWSLLKEKNQIDERHRPKLVPLVTRLLMPKVRKLKVLGSHKQASVNLRKAVLQFFAQLDTIELPLFFALLLKPLNIIPREADASANWFCNLHLVSINASATDILKYFSTESIVALSWKKKYGFMHVIEEVLTVFDEMLVSPFLNIILGCVVRVLASCTASLHVARQVSLFENGKTHDNNLLEMDKEAAFTGLTSTAVKQHKDLRSLCLRVISVVLYKYEGFDFEIEFWDLFFMSVKSSIESFKHEGSSSEKPSSLFSCFLAMSRSHKLVPLLARERNLVPDIFFILTISTASQPIISFVLQFIENLLTFDGELDGNDSAVRSVLLPNLDSLIQNLHVLFQSGDAKKRKLVGHLNGPMIRIFKLLSKFVREQLHAKKFVEIVLPYLTQTGRTSESHADTLQIVQNVVPILGSGSTTKILKAVSPLLIFVEQDLRLLVCDLINALAEVDSSILCVAQIIRGLNATSSMEIGGLDFDTIVNSYEKINIDFFCATPEEHALVVLSQCVHDMSSEELILRHSAYRCLLAFVEFSSSVLGQRGNGHQESIDNMTLSDNSWSKESIMRLTNKFILKHMGEAMNRETSVKKEWINLLREMVLKFPEVANLSSLKALYSKDAEVDFFSNITHLQKLRRAKALIRFKNTIPTVNVPEVITKNVFVPLFFNMLFDLQEGKAENIRVACIEALASISGQMEWKSYFALLRRCLRDLTKHPDKKKVLMRLICSILDNFHFQENMSEVGSTQLYGSTVVTNNMQACLSKDVFPKIQKLMNSQSERVDIYVHLAALKLLKLLPEDVMDSQLLSIIQHIVNFLKNRLESVRDEARSSLAACLKVLGSEYLQVIVRVLRGSLKRGYEMHVLGYTLNFILSKLFTGPAIGKIDYLLDDLISVAEKDILGEVAEEKEVEKLASKMKETRKQKSFETLKLIAQSITFKSHALKLLRPVTDHMKKHLTPKVKTKLENMLTSVAAGFESNPSVNQTDLLIFINGLIEDGVKGENGQGEISSVADANKHSRDVSRGKNVSCQTILVKSPCSHLIVVFALKLLHGFMKKMQLGKGHAQLLSMLDPFVPLLGNCLTSKYEDVLSLTLRCLTPLLRLPLPSVKSQADKIKGVVLHIAQSSVDPRNPLVESCLRLLTVLLRNEKVTLSTDQLHLLIQFPLFVDIDKNPSFVALSLLKAIVSRKLVVPEIYDLAIRVAELMVTSQVEPIRKKCSKILLQFLLDYHLSEKRLQQHLDFLLSNLRYEHSTGREAVLEMLHAIVVKFSKSVVDSISQRLFIRLVACLANDHDHHVRSMTGLVIKSLTDRISPGSQHSILEFGLSWYLGEKQQLWNVAAQVLGLLVEVEALKEGFERHIQTVLPVARGILQSVVDVTMNEQIDISAETTITFWKEAYYSLVMLEKLMHRFPQLFFKNDFEDIWEMISHLLLHPHMWIRSISTRMIASYFRKIVIENNGRNSERLLGAYSLMKPSRLFLIATSFCYQLKSELTDKDADLIVQNLVFAICGLHSVIGEVENADSRPFWSTLEESEQRLFLKAFQLLESGKGRSILLPRITGVFNQNDACPEEIRHLLISNLLKKMGKVALQMDTIQMAIVFNVFRNISSQVGVEDCEQYAFEILLPLYKVREGFSGKMIPESMVQLAQEVCDKIQNCLGIQKFVQVYNQIKKSLKAKRDKRKQEEKRMAVINPMRNAKRKLRIAEKQRASKRRKITTMRMSRRML